MNIRMFRRWIAGAAMLAVSFSGAAFAESSEAAAETDTTLRTEVEELRERLAQLEELLSEKMETAPATEEEQIEAGYAEGRTLVLPSAPTQAQSDEDAIVGPVVTGGPTLNFTGLIDTYYTYNANRPGEGTNTLYYTNPSARGFGLNQAKLELDAQTDTGIGFRTDIWFGSGARLFRDGLEDGPLEDVLYLQQAYGYYVFENGSELDVGLFGTIAGLEVAESHLNWNYTRGILWAWNEPFSHMGAKFSTPISDTFTATVMLVNGFDNAFDDNFGKSYGVQGSWAPDDKFNTTMTWIHGPENGIGEDGWQRNFSWNAYLGLHEKFEIMGNLDYISNTDPIGNELMSWGMGAYARYNATDRFRIAQRFEFLEDRNGRATGVEHTLKEYTLTFEYAPEPRFITRFEWRHDWSTVPFFSSTDSLPGIGQGLDFNQDTFTVALMWILGPAE